MNAKHSFEEPMAGEDDAEDRKRKALDDVPLSVREGGNERCWEFNKQIS